MSAPEPGATGRGEPANDVVTRVAGTPHDVAGAHDLAQLERQSRAGDAQAFGALLRLHDHDLRGVVWAVVRDGHAVDDVMQTAYEKAFRAIGSFAGDSSLKTWLHSICYRCAIDHVRHEGRRAHVALDVLADRPGDASTTDDALARLSLADALNRLDPETRALVMMTTALGLSFDETAEVTGLARGTVASRVGRARELLRRTVPR